MQSPRLQWARVLSKHVRFLFTVLPAAFLAGCGSVIATPPPPPPTLVVDISSLPNGNVGQPYSVTLTVSGGKAPYTWNLKGPLPAGLALTPATGVINGTPTSVANAVALTMTATDSSAPQQSASATLHLTVNASVQGSPLVISTSSLPNGNIGVAYSTTLAVTGGQTPYTWSLRGPLPAGLALAPATGIISGTPASAANAAALVLTATDSSTPPHSGSATLNLTILANVAVSTQQTAAVTTQSVAVQSTTNDPTGVNWSASGPGCSASSCGTFSSTNSLNGVATNWTAPSSPGVYTLTAVSAGDGTTSASLTIPVTDLSGVSTVHYDLHRDGVNSQEYALTPALVTGSTFGKLFSCTVDGAVYAQPLWAPQLTIGGTKHNVIFVATEHDSLFAFDADSNTSPCIPLWSVSLIDTGHGGTPGETPVPGYGSDEQVGVGYGDIAPEVGVTGTPVIDPATHTLYVVSKSMDSSQINFYQRLHAIDMTSGSEKFSGPAVISGTYPGTYGGGTTTTFNARQQNQRPGLTLMNGTIYIAWGSHEDDPPFCGWVMGYDATTLAQKFVLNVTPNTGGGGIWMNGAAPAADANGNLYLSTGNGIFDGNSLASPSNDYSDSILQLNSALGIQQYFTPTDEKTDEADDLDVSSAGTILIDLPANGSNATHLLVNGAKDGTYYIVNRDNMGGFGNSNAWQLLYLGAGIFSTPAYWDNTLYVPANNQAIQAYEMNPQTAKITSSPSSITPNTFGFPGTNPAISAMPDGSNAILWAINYNSYCTPRSKSCGPAVLHAYSATNLATELWNSSTNPANTAGYPVKYTVPTVANGHVYIGTRGNNIGGPDSSTSIPGELDVYGILIPGN